MRYEVVYCISVSTRSTSDCDRLVRKVLTMVCDGMHLAYTRSQASRPILSLELATQCPWMMVPNLVTITGKTDLKMCR